MKRYERKRLLERVDREGATVGATIPETVDLDGEPFDLRAFVFETKSVERVAAEERRQVQEVKKRLRRARLTRRRRLEDEGADVPREEGERLVEEIVGIDRALNALESLGPTDLEDEMRARETADRKRWREFLQRALGQDGDGGIRR